MQLTKTLKIYAWQNLIEAYELTQSLQLVYSYKVNPFLPTGPFLALNVFLN